MHKAKCTLHRPLPQLYPTSYPNTVGLGLRVRALFGPFYTLVGGGEDGASLKHNWIVKTRPPVF